MSGFIAREIISGWMGVAYFDHRKLNPRYKIKGYDGKIRNVPYFSFFEHYEADLIGFAEAKADKYANELRNWYGDVR